MWKSIAGWVSHQVRLERSKLLAAGGLPFSELLPASHVDRVLEEGDAKRVRTIYLTPVGLGVSLPQCLVPSARLMTVSFTT